MRFIFTFLFLLGLFACHAPSGSVATPAFTLEEYTIDQLQDAYAAGELTVAAVVQQYLDRIEALDQNGPLVNSVIEVNPDALAIAKQLDEERKNGQSRGPLHGIPVLLKDNIDTHDQMHTTAGSRALAGSQPLQDSWVAAKLREAGAVILGKANLSEWANFRGNLSTSGWSGVGGQTKNPYLLDRNPCGSSAGSGASVSANFCMLAIGTETNGSIVCPATANGIVGIKPTVGLISRAGIIPISFTQDTPGPMARTVKDAAICLGTMVGEDPLDSKTTQPGKQSHLDYTQFLNPNGLRGKRIGWYTRSQGTNYKVDSLMAQTLADLKSQGAEIIELNEIAAGNAGAYSFQVLLYEFKDGLNQYFASLGENALIKSVEELIVFNQQDSVEMQFYDQDLVLQAQAKGDLTEPEYLEARQKMKEIMGRDGIDRVMNEHQLDAIMAPTGSPAWKTDWINGDSFQIGSSSPAAIAGYPNITVPMGFVSGLPVGVSFFGRAWSEPVLLEIAYAYEQATMHRQPPQFLAE